MVFVHQLWHLCIVSNKFEHEIYCDAVRSIVNCLVVVRCVDTLSMGHRCWLVCCRRRPVSGRFRMFYVMTMPLVMMVSHRHHPLILSTWQPDDYYLYYLSLASPTKQKLTERNPLVKLDANDFPFSSSSSSCRLVLNHHLRMILNIPPNDHHFYYERCEGQCIYLVVRILCVVAALFIIFSKAHGNTARKAKRKINDSCSDYYDDYLARGRSVTVNHLFYCHYRLRVYFNISVALHTVKNGKHETGRLRWM